jgi:hypothetical protein
VNSLYLPLAKATDNLGCDNVSEESTVSVLTEAHAMKLFALFAVSSVYSLALKTEPVYSSETANLLRTTRHTIPEQCTRHKNVLFMSEV